MLDKTLLQKFLPTVSVITKETTVSTNNDAKLLINDVKNDILITAEEQTGGRGRQGKSFLSPIGGLYMTLLLKCSLPITSAVCATSCSAVAAARAIKKLCGIDCGIKWVNDIYADGRKLCGILTEAVNDYDKMTTEYIIIGIGINVLSSPEMTDSTVQSVSLSELGAYVSRELLCAEIANELILMRDCGFDFSRYYSEYTSLSVILGHEISFTQNGVTKNGIACGFDESGGLIVDCDEQKLHLSSGEISVRMKKTN